MDNSIDRRSLLIGAAASSGCVRLVNDHIMQLYEAVPLGTRAILHSPFR